MLENQPYCALIVRAYSDILLFWTPCPFDSHARPLILPSVGAAVFYVVMIIFYFTSGAKLNQQIGPDSMAAKRIAKLIRQIAACLLLGVVSFAGCTSVEESKRGLYVCDDLRRAVVERISRDRLCMCQTFGARI